MSAYVGILVVKAFSICTFLEVYVCPLLENTLFIGGFLYKINQQMVLFFPSPYHIFSNHICITCKSYDLFCRPTMSFRHCTASADRMAKTSYQSWVATRVIPHPLIPLFVSNLDTCLTDMWKVWGLLDISLCVIIIASLK